MRKLNLLLAGLLISNIALAQTSVEDPSIKFLEAMMGTNAAIDDTGTDKLSKIGTRGILEGFTKNKTPLEGRIRPNAPWNNKLSKLADEEDEGTVIVDEKTIVKPPERTSSVYFPGPTKAVVGAAHSPISAKIANEMLKGPMALYYIAMQQTDPAIGSGLDMAEQYSQNMVVRAVELEGSFIKSLEARPDGDNIKKSYYGCITRHMTGADYPEVAKTTPLHKDPNKTWLQSVHLCMNDSLIHQGANFDSLNASAQAGAETFMLAIDNTYLAELNKYKEIKAVTWDLCADPTNTDNPASAYDLGPAVDVARPAELSKLGDPGVFKSKNPKTLHTTVLSVANLIFCPQMMAYDVKIQTFLGKAGDQKKFDEIKELRKSWLELFGDYLLIFEQGREVRIAVDPTYSIPGRELKVPDFSVAKTSLKKIPARRSDSKKAISGGASGVAESYPVELYYELKDARFKDLTSLLSKECEFVPKEVKDGDNSGFLKAQFWSQLVDGAMPEEALKVPRLSLLNRPYNADMSARFLEMLYTETSKKDACAQIKQLSLTGSKLLRDDDPFIGVYSIYWNYAEFVAFEQLMRLYLFAAQFAADNLPYTVSNEPVLEYALKLVYDAAGTEDIIGAIKENTMLFDAFAVQVSQYTASRKANKKVKENQ